MVVPPHAESSGQGGARRRDAPEHDEQHAAGRADAKTVPRWPFDDGQLGAVECEAHGGRAAWPALPRDQAERLGLRLTEVAQLGAVDHPDPRSPRFHKGRATTRRPAQASVRTTMSDFR